ncbi:MULTISPECIES: DUF2511 domain-containing protein [Trichocoleus]|uniref:YebY family protein n=1 Tax=Trichocoleus desertorum GB2-A4 TaxID=2933944 RepID=A0ABV0JEC6_9CYAN|nr:DUF2511 domain-containing protein [Trichocoleus sp. FACHB-46]MBD1864296.1 DUF2511 domain-containing protein [Trichocoleus sp. FACHB-46]
MRSTLQKLALAIAAITLSISIVFSGVLPIMAATSNSITISQAEFGDSWPFTVSNGELYCIGEGNGQQVGAVVFATEDESYAVNGTAKALGYKAIEEIWRSNPAIPGTKINIGPIIQRGLEICK